MPVIDRLKCLWRSSWCASVCMQCLQMIRTPLTIQPAGAAMMADSRDTTANPIQQQSNPDRALVQCPHSVGGEPMAQIDDLLLPMRQLQQVPTRGQPPQ